MRSFHSAFVNPIAAFRQRLFRRSPAVNLALGAIGLWASLATLARELAHLPPFFLVGSSLLFGALPGLHHLRSWRRHPQLILLGGASLFAYHFLLFMAFRLARPMEANLINYLWPVFIVLLSACFLPGFVLKARHAIGAGLSFCGAFFVLWKEGAGFETRHAEGYLCAVAAAFIWAAYSVFTKRAAFPSVLVGGFCFVSGLLSLACHFLLEIRASLSAADWALLALLGLGPMGLAFYAWDAALKRGHPPTIAALSYLTPVLSTGMLVLAGGETLGWSLALALVLILAGAVVSRDKKQAAA